MGSAQPIIIAGIPIPTDTPLFLAFVGIHVIFGLACVIAGFVAMLAPKASGRHPISGTIYFRCLLVVFASAIILATLRWPKDTDLLALGTGAWLSAWAGRWARRRFGHARLRWHIAGMGFSYVLLLTAFYVDNGRFLPFWKQIPGIFYWIIPAAVGIPLIARAMLWHPLVRQRMTP